jgi:lipopolysaccharide biosynthesis glycosyltransferase
MKKRLIVTIMFGKDPSYYFAKKTFESYAKKVNADFICLERPSHIFQSTNKNYNKNALDALFEKISLGTFANKYDQVLYIDADILITPHAEDIFILNANKSAIHMFNEGLISDRSRELTLISNYLKDPVKDNNYFNAGVILFPSTVDFLTSIRIYELEQFFTSSSWFDQTYVNFKVRFRQLHVENLEQKFNCMAQKNGNEKRFLASFIHYAGNGYCHKKQRPVFMLSDYCHLYNYSLSVKEKTIFVIHYANQRFMRIIRKFRLF